MSSHRSPSSVLYLQHWIAPCPEVSKLPTAAPGGVMEIILDDELVAYQVPALPDNTSNAFGHLLSPHSQGCKVG